MLSEVSNQFCDATILEEYSGCTGDAERSPMIQTLSLWKHQRQAVAVVREYLDAYRRGKTKGAALVHMPTGSGKTGVIAAIARCLPEVGAALVVAPRVALRDQLWRDVSSRFFDGLERKPAKVPKTVIRLVSASQAATELNDAVVVSTIQKLESMRRRGGKLYHRLQRETALLIFDEGHYEPAPVWRDVVRAIRSPRVIFTATPYRNDLKLFDVDFNYVFSYTMREAVEDRFVRRVKIHQAPATRSPQAFVEQVLHFYNDHWPRSNAVRVIVRCESPEAIRQICTALVGAGRTCVGIHETFGTGSSHLFERHSVPDPSKTEATFWVHQFKLLEGIDDPRFRLLALYDELRSVRTFVQQVGRIIRNPEQAREATAHVLDHSKGRQAELWQNYLKYDTLVQESGISVLAKSNEVLVEAVSGVQPAVVYLDGRFRTSVDLDVLDPQNHLQLPLTVNVYRKEPGFRIGRSFEAILRAHAEADRVPRPQPLQDDVGVIWYVGVRNSPLLRDGAFLEHRLGVTLLRELDQYVCYFDSSGMAAPQVDGLGPPVPLRTLRKLFQKREGCYLTSVALRNADPGLTVVRGRAISAVDIDATAPAFDDHAFVCSTAYGYSAWRPKADSAEFKRIRRYVGFGSGKVSDLTGKWVPFTEYLAWLEEIRSVLASSTSGLPTFRRYASAADVPADPSPVSVLLDLGEIRDRYLTVGSAEVPGDQPMEIDELCQQVENGSCSMAANGRQCSVSIEFDRERGRYSLRSPELDALYYSPDPDQREGLIQYLNASQSIRVIPKSPGMFYTEGQFYRPLIRFGPEYDDGKMGVLRTLVPIGRLAEVASEKGTKCLARGAGWEPGCLFHLIDTLGVGCDLAGYFAGTEILVCDDMGDESADFILVQAVRAEPGRRRVAFVHAKSRATASFYSASDLQDVCSQAVKNLGELALFGDSRADRQRKWARRWSSGQVEGYVARRIRRAQRQASVWEDIRRSIRDPTAEREVWLVLGRILSKARLEEELTKAQPHTAAVQAAYLLFSTLTATASGGARLRVFCSP